MPLSIAEGLPCQHTTWGGQFADPCGWRGWVVGWLMALKNRERSEWVLSLLDLRPGARVLEIGYGPGADVARVLRAADGITVAGLDRSAVMRQLASRRNAGAVQDGRADLRVGEAGSLPFGENEFDSAFSINCAQFWPDPLAAATEIRRVLKPGGYAVIALQPRNRGATRETIARTGEWLAATLTAAGFHEVYQRTHPMKPVPAVCALAAK